MTTLPQTTSTVRLPRPVSGLQPVPVGGVPAVTGASGAMTGADVWRIIRGNIWLILAMIFLSAIAGFGINQWLKIYHPKYTARGYIQVVPLHPLNPLSEGEQTLPAEQLGIELRTQVYGLTSDLLLSNVLQKSDSPIRATSLFGYYQDPSDFREYFFDNFVVTPLADTKLIKIEFSCAKAKEAHTIVQTMGDAHIDQQREVGLQMLQDSTVELTHKETGLRAELNDDQNSLDQLNHDLNMEGAGINRVGVTEMELQARDTEMLKEESDWKRGQETYNALKAQIERGETPYTIQSYIDQNPMILDLQQHILIYQQDVDAKRAQGMGENNERLKQAVALLTKTQQQLDDKKAEVRSQGISLVLGQAQGIAESARQRFEDLQMQVKDLKTELVDLSSRLRQYMLLVNQMQGLNEELRNVKQKLDNADQKTIKNMQTKVDWFQRPEIPITLTFPKLAMVMTISITVGLALALGIAFLREVTDTTVRSPRDIARVGQMNMLGMVADETDDPQAAGARLPLVIFDAPHSMTAEQLRQVRTRLQHAVSLDTTRSIMISSPSPGDGKTTIACNLAAGLALNGRRILLVDGNFRRPEIHRIFAVGNEQGFSDVLNGALPFDQAVQETQVPNLSIMPSGPRPVNATEIFESQLLVDFIERALEEFDHVIFDSGPLMVVSESVAMAPRVDGVVSVVRARGNSRGLLGRMREVLRQIKAEHLGVVLNAVRAQGGGYYRRNIQTYYDYSG